MNVSNRAFESEADLQRMSDMDSRSRALDPRGGYWRPGDLWYGYSGLAMNHDPSQHIQLWERTDEIVGWAWCDSAGCSFNVHPSVGLHVLGDELLCWGMARFERMREGDTPFSTDCHDDNDEKAAFLTTRGFVRDEEGCCLVNLYRSLDDSIASPVLPDGFVARTLAGEGELAARAEAHCDAFGSDWLTAERYTRMTKLAGYQRDLDSVIVAPDGTIVAFALGWLDRHNGLGQFEPVGVRRAFRNRGLGRAALRESMRRMQSLGATMAYVAVEHDNAPARRLYESVGFREVRRNYGYLATRRIAKPDSSRQGVAD